MSWAVSSGSPLGSTVEESELDQGLQDSFNSIYEQEIEIIELQANAGITPFTHDTTLSDTFSDSNGYLNTVLTGDTTAQHSTNKYQRVPLGGVNVNDVISGVNGSGDVYFYAGQTGTTSCTSSGSAGAWKWYNADIINASIVQDTTRIGNTSDFYLITQNSSVIKVVKNAAADGDISLTLDMSAIYDIGGNGCDMKFIVNGSVVDTQTCPPTIGWNTYSYNFVGLTTGDEFGVLFDWKGDASYDQFAIKEFIFGGGIDDTAVISVDLGTISGTVTHTQLIVNDPDRETGDDITYNLTNGTDTDSDQTLNASNGWSGTTNPDTLEINLVPAASSPTTGYPSVKSYCLKIWKA